MASFSLDLGSIICVKFKPLLKIDVGDGSYTLSVRYTVTFLCLFCPLGVFYCIGSQMSVFNAEGANNRAGHDCAVEPRDMGCLEKTFRQNGFGNHAIKQVLHTSSKPQMQTTKPLDTVIHPYRHQISNEISRLLAKHSIPCHSAEHHQCT